MALCGEPSAYNLQAGGISFERAPSEMLMLVSADSTFEHRRYLKMRKLGRQ